MHGERRCAPMRADGVGRRLGERRFDRRCSGLMSERVAHVCMSMGHTNSLPELVICIGASQQDAGECSCISPDPSRCTKKSKGVRRLSRVLHETLENTSALRNPDPCNPP